MNSSKPHLPTKPRTSSQRGFTLMELMAVVIIIGIFSAMAMPGMARARLDRRVYEDATDIAELIREGRAQAMGRGAAVLVTLSTANSIGTFNSWEAVGPNPAGAGLARIPVNTCKSPTIWTNAIQRNAIRTVDLNAAGGLDIQAHLLTQIRLANGTIINTAHLCFTPNGRTFMVTGNGVAPVFDGSNPMTEVLEVVVSRTEGGVTAGLRRGVLIPPTGIARIHSY